MPQKKNSPLSSFLMLTAYKRNLVINCKNSVDTKEKFDLFMYGWNLLMMAKSEEDFVRLFDQLNEDAHAFPKVHAHVKTI